MERRYSKQQKFDGWDSTPNIDNSQTNALKYYCSLFQKEVSTEKQSQMDKSVERNNYSSKKLLSVSKDDDEKLQNHKRKEKSRQNLNINYEYQDKYGLGKLNFINEVNRENKQFKLHIPYNGIRDACIYQVSGNDRYVQNNSQFISNPNDELNNSQIFMKKNIFQLKSKRNSQHDTINHLKFSYSYQSSVKFDGVNTSKNDSTNSQFKEGRYKEKQTNEYSNDSLVNVDISNSNQGNNTNYHFLNCAKIYTIENNKEEKTQNKYKKQTVNLSQDISITQQSFQSDNNIQEMENTPPSSKKYKQKRLRIKDLKQVKLETSIHNTLSSSPSEMIKNEFISKSQDNNQYTNQTNKNNNIIQNSEKFIPFHQQEINSQSVSLEKYNKNKSSSQKLSSSNIEQIDCDKDQSKYKQNDYNNQTSLNSLIKQDSQYNRERLPLKYKQQINRISFQNDSNGGQFYEEMASDILDTSIDQIRESQIAKNFDQIRISQRSPYQQSKDKNQQQSMVSSIQKNQQQFKSFIKGKKCEFLIQNSPIQKQILNSPNFLSNQEQNTQSFSVKNKRKARNLQIINDDFNNQEQVQINKIPLINKQFKQELLPYCSANKVNLLSCITKRNKSLDLQINQVSTRDNTQIYKQSDKLPFLNLKIKNQNDFLKLLNKQIVSSQKSQNLSKQSLNQSDKSINLNEKSKDNTNSSEIIEINSKNSNQDSRNSLFQLPQSDEFKMKQVFTENSPQNKIKVANKYNVQNYQLNVSFNKNDKNFHDQSQIRINQRYVDKNENNPVKKCQSQNNQQQLIKESYINRLQYIQHNQQTDLPENILDQLARQVQTKSQRSSSIDQIMSLRNSLKSEKMQNNQYKYKNHQNELNYYNDSYVSNRKNKLRIFQHNQMYKSIDPN